MELFVPVVIGRSNCFGFGFSTVIWKPLYMLIAKLYRVCRDLCLRGWLINFRRKSEISIIVEAKPLNFRLRVANQYHWTSGRLRKKPSARPSEWNLWPFDYVYGCATIELEEIRENAEKIRVHLLRSGIWSSTTSSDALLLSYSRPGKARKKSTCYFLRVEPTTLRVHLPQLSSKPTCGRMVF